MSEPDYFFQLQERIKGHPGKPIFDALRAYDMSKFIFDGNISHLRKLICVLEDPKDPAQVMSLKQRIFTTS